MLSTLQYPTIQSQPGEAQPDLQIRELSIFPAIFTLRPAPAVSFPADFYTPHIHSDKSYQYHSLSCSQLRNFQFGFPRGILLGHPTENSHSSSTIYVLTPESSEHAHRNLAIKSKQPRGYRHGGMTIKVPQSHADAQSSLTTPSTLITFDDSLSSARLPPTPATTTSAHPGNDTGVSVPLYTRPASSLGRRYSVPGDNYTVYHGEPVCPGDPIVWVNAVDSLQIKDCRLRLGIKGREHSGNCVQDGVKL